MPFLLKELWTDLFHAASTDVRFDEKLRAFPIAVKVSQITSELQQAYGSRRLEHDERSAEFPKQSWIREALETLVSVRLAIPGSDRDSYTVLFRRYSEDLLEKFAELLQNQQEPAEVKGQLPLPLALLPDSVGDSTSPSAPQHDPAAKSS